MNNIRPRKLSPREREVLQDIAEGRSTKEIAAKYAITLNTAKAHRHNIIKKMKVSNTTEAAVKFACSQNMPNPFV